MHEPRDPLANLMQGPAVQGQKPQIEPLQLTSSDSAIVRMFIAFAILFSVMALTCAIRKNIVRWTIW